MKRENKVKLTLVNHSLHYIKYELETAERQGCMLGSDFDNLLKSIVTAEKHIASILNKKCKNYEKLAK